MIIDCKKFLALMRRATRCGYPSVILNNHMLMQCYDLDIDQDIGLHYVLHIPDDYDTTTDFYDHTLILNPRSILKQYNCAKKEAIEERKKQGLLPRAMTEILEVHEHKHHLELEFGFYLAGEQYVVTTIELSTDIEQTDPMLEKCALAYDQLMGRIKAGGACLAFNGGRMGLQPLIVECPEIYWYRVNYAGKRIMIPFTRSMFLGIKEVDNFTFSIQETLLDDIYVLSIMIEKKGIAEQFWGYVLQYK